MKNVIFIIFALLSSAISIANESIYGLWQFEGNAVYILINEDGTTFQCRIAMDRSVISANGKLIAGPSTMISWQPLKIVDASGNSIDSNGFDWGTDTLEFTDGKLTLKGPYGNFSYKKCYMNLPPECGS